MDQTERPKIVASDRVFKALQDAGIFHVDERVTRVVIDLKIGEAPLLYVERFGDARLVDVLPTVLKGAEVRETPNPLAAAIAEATANPGRTVEVGS